jgi:type VI secretion system protein ImpG
MIFIFDRENQKLKGKVNKKNFELFCTPAVNMFGHNFSEISLGEGFSNIDFLQKYPSPENLEILKILEVHGSSERNDEGRTFSRLHSTLDIFDDDSANDEVRYSLNCVPGTLTEKELESESKTNYAGTNTYISLFDNENEPGKGNLNQLRIITLCSNRGLPFATMSEKKDVYFEVDSAHIAQAKLISGPTEPYCDHLFINPWEIINHISVNFLNLNDEIPGGFNIAGNYRIDSGQNNKEKFEESSLFKPGGTKADIIRQILEMYTVSETQKKSVKGLRSITTAREQQRFNNDGDFSFVYGLNIDVKLDEQEANNYFLLGMIIDRFFMYATPTDTFTQTTVSTEKRGKIIQWPVRKGARPLI